MTDSIRLSAAAARLNPLKSGLRFALAGLLVAGTVSACTHASPERERLNQALDNCETQMSNPEQRQDCSTDAMNRYMQEHNAKPAM